MHFYACSACCLASGGGDCRRCTQATAARASRTRVPRTRRLKRSSSMRPCRRRRCRPPRATAQLARTAAGASVSASVPSGTSRHSHSLLLRSLGQEAPPKVATKTTLYTIVLSLSVCCRPYDAIFYQFAFSFSLLSIHNGFDFEVYDSTLSRFSIFAYVLTYLFSSNTGHANILYTISHHPNHHSHIHTHTHATLRDLFNSCSARCFLSFISYVLSFESFILFDTKFFWDSSKCDSCTHCDNISRARPYYTDYH